jgi:hypothetical protein
LKHLMTAQIVQSSSGPMSATAPLADDGSTT